MLFSQVRRSWSAGMADKGARTAAAIARKALEQATAAAAAKGKPLRQKKFIELHRRIKAETKTPWRVHFPNEIIQFMPNQQESEQLDTVKFRVNPRLNKFDIKQWIEAGYDTPVEKVNTINYEGRLRRQPNGRTWKRPDYKVAYVKLEKPWSVPNQ